MSIYALLESRCLPLIRAFHDDLLKHDKAAIAESPGMPFVHWTRDCGTHIQMLPPPDHECFPKAGVFVPFLFGTVDREGLLKAMLSMADYHAMATSNPERFTVHYFDGKRLRLVTVQAAREIVRDHVCAVRAAWSEPFVVTPTNRIATYA